MYRLCASPIIMILSFMTSVVVAWASPTASAATPASVAKSQTRVQIRGADPLPREIPLPINRDLPAGALIRIKTDSVSFLRSAIVQDVLLENGHTCEALQRFCREEMSKNWSWYTHTLSMIVVRVGEPMKAGMHLRILFSKSEKSSDGTKAKGERRSPYSGLTSSIAAGLVHDPRDLEFDPLGEPVVFEFLPGPTNHMEAYLKPDGLVRVSWFDALGNTTPSAQAKLTCTAKDLRFTADNAPIQVPATVDRVTIKDAAGHKAVSNARPIAIDGTPIWFGEFHWHTRFSGDGQNTIAAGLANARDGLGLDFAGPADHISPNGQYAHGLTPKEQAQQCLPFEKPGQFAIIAGGELSQRFGHANIYAADFPTLIELAEKLDESIKSTHERYSYPHKAVSSICPSGRALYIPHHPNTSSGAVLNADGLPLWFPMTWPVCGANDALRLVEICQVRGAFETEEFDKTWGMEDRGGGGSVQTALARGYRVGFTAGTDNHSGWPTRGPDGPVAITAVQSAKLDQKSIFDALYQRRCYATSGARIVADAKLNDHPIGSEIKLRPCEQRIFKIMIKGTSPLAAVQIIHNGIILVDLPIDTQSLDFKGEWTDTRPYRPLNDTYYYVRARQADGHRVWLSPWWVNVDDSASPPYSLAWRILRNWVY